MYGAHHEIHQEDLSRLARLVTAKNSPPKSRFKPHKTILERINLQMRWILEGESVMASPEGIACMKEMARLKETMCFREGLINIYYGTYAWRALFGFVCPNPSLFDAIENAIAKNNARDGGRKNSAGILEVGAGSGLLSLLARLRGINAVACDIRESTKNPILGALIDRLMETRAEDAETHSEESTKKTLPTHPVWVEIFEKDASEVIKAAPNRNVLMAWQSLDEEWATRAAKSMESGRLLFLIGEGEGGCTGSDTLFETLREKFHPEGSGVFESHEKYSAAIKGAITPLPTISDRLSIYIKK